MAPKQKNAAAVALAKLAAIGRKNISPEKRTEYARNAAKARWAKVRAKRAAEKGKA
jgi:hypothetical protein